MCCASSSSSSSPVVLIVSLSLRLCPTSALWLRARSHFIIVRPLWRFVLPVFYKLLGSNACNDNNDFDTPTLNSQRYVLPWISCVISWQVDRTCNCFHSEWLISSVVVVVVASRFVSFFFFVSDFIFLLLVVGFFLIFILLAFCYICLVCAMCAARVQWQMDMVTPPSQTKGIEKDTQKIVIVFVVVVRRALRLSVVRWELKYIIFMCENFFVAWHSINGICIALRRDTTTITMDRCGWMRAPDTMEFCDYDFASQCHARHSSKLYAASLLLSRLKATIKFNERMTLQFCLLGAAAHARTSTFRCDVFWFL